MEVTEAEMRMEVQAHHLKKVQAAAAHSIASLVKVPIPQVVIQVLLLVFNIKEVMEV